MANLPDSPDPFLMLSGSTPPNAYFLCLTTTDIESLPYLTIDEIEEPQVAGYRRLPIEFNVQVASDNSSLVAICDETYDDSGEPQYLDFECGDDAVDVQITAAYVIASFDDQDYLLYTDEVEQPIEWYVASDSARVEQITIQASTWVLAS